MIFLEVSEIILIHFYVKPLIPNGSWFKYICVCLKCFRASSARVSACLISGYFYKNCFSSFDTTSGILSYLNCAALEIIQTCQPVPFV